jgi:hypothetical protein
VSKFHVTIASRTLIVVLVEQSVEFLKEIRLKSMPIAAEVRTRCKKDAKQIQRIALKKWLSTSRLFDIIDCNLFPLEHTVVANHR